MGLAEASRVVLDAASRRSQRVALVGGFAVSVRTEPRFTRDVDFVVSVSGDPAAEALVADLAAGGHRLLASVEHEAAQRLASVRIALAAGGMLDLLFASSGIETEIAHDADLLEVLPGLRLPVATTGHLIALKVLARDDERRPQDASDLVALRRVATASDIEQARVAVRLIQKRGFDRGRDLVADLESVLGEH